MAGITARHDGRNFNEHSDLILFRETLGAATGLVERTSASALLLLEHHPVDMAKGSYPFTENERSW